MVQTSLFADRLEAISVRAHEPLEPDAVRLAILVYVGAETFKHVCQAGELDFVVWRRRMKERLADQAIEPTEAEMAWLQARLLDEPTLKAGDGDARANLNARLANDPALLAGETIALFMKGSIKKNVSRLDPASLKEPTALITLTEPLRFVCERGAIFEIRESPVVAQMDIRAVPGWTGDVSQEAERFVLPEEDFSVKGGRVFLRYPSLNKAFPAIFHRLHVREGRQNTNRSIYHHAVWATCGRSGRPEYHSLWSIRDGVRLRTWRCPGR